MPDLSPEAQALVRSGRHAYRPNEADRERVLDALRGQLGDAVVLGAAAPRSFAASAHAKAIRTALSYWKTMGLAVFAGGSLIFGLRLEYGHASSSPRAPGAAIVVGAATNDLLPSNEDTPLPEVSTGTEEKPASPLVDARPVSPRHTHDGLSDEIAILSRAETELHGGRPESALKALDEHERRFPNGVLTEERIAARSQALCALGRTAEADAQLARLARISPHSAHEERARQACHETAPLAP
jgi:hypothetical protein